MYDLTEALVTSLPTERWFQGRTRELRGITVVDAVRMSEKLLDCFVEVHYADGLPERYQVPVVQGETFSDATADPEACRLFAELAVANTSVRTDQGDRVTGHPVGGQLPDLGARPCRLPAEQSNTSVVFGDQAILKLFRRLEPGINPDVEVTRALTAAGFPYVPAQYGAFTLEDTALGMLSEFVSGRDGFEAATAEATNGKSTAVLDAVGVLGVVVADLHEVLREVLGESEATERGAAARSAAMRAHAEEQLALAGDHAPESAAPVLERRVELLDRLDALGTVADLGPLVRVHGDLHLGQTLLIADGSWRLLDFEGEPARPLAKRRARSSPLQDVAGMLRSFDYVAGAEPAEAALRWRDQARARFLDAYLTRAEVAGLLPEEPEPVLAAFELDKAVYELGYELRCRPDWVGIPVTGIRRVLDCW